MANDNTDMVGIDSARISQSDVMSNSLRAVNMAAGGLSSTNLPNRARANTAIVATPTTRDYGDYTDIQKALDFVNSQGGGTVYIKPGTYLISSVLTIYSNTQLIGLSNNGVIFDFQKKSIGLQTATNANWVRIQDITLQNSTSSTGTIQIGLLISKVWVVSCVFKNNTVDIYTNDDFDITIDRNISNNCGTFYQANTTTGRSLINNNTIYSPTSYAFLNCSNSVLTGNNINTPASSVFRGDFSNSIIEGNSVSGTGKKFIDFTAGNYVRVVNNFLNNNIISLSGVGYSDICNNDYATYITLASSSSQNRISGNFCSNQTVANQATILVDGSNSNTITGNVCFTFNSTSGADGIRFANSASNNTATGNRVNASATGTTYGINILGAGCTSNIVVGNSTGGTSGATSDTGTTSVVASNG